MRPILTAILSTAAVTATAAAAEGLVSRSYNVGNFSGVEVAGPYNVEIRTGQRVSVSGTGTPRLMEKTVVEVKGDRLVIHPQRENNWFGGNWNWMRDEKARFVVTVPQLNAATIAGSGNVNVDRVRGQRFDGRVAGSGNLQLGSLEVQDAKFGIAGSGDARVLGGRVGSANYSIAGSGAVQAAALAAQNAKISIAGSGDVAARASGSADISIMGSGDVVITGGARCNVSKMGSGRARCS